ncbi:MAG: hypothetical protein ACRD3N_13325 [Terracidiphilus sp.]
MPGSGGRTQAFPRRWRCFLEESRVQDFQETIRKGKIRPFGKTTSSLTKFPIADAHGDIGGDTGNDAKMAELNAACDAVMRERKTQGF